MTTTPNKTHPILMTPEMVRATLDGRKTQTRRPVKGPKGYVPLEYLGEYPTEEDGIDRHWWVWSLSSEAGLLTPYAVGDVLWVREAWGIEPGRCVSPFYGDYGGRFDDEIFYKADANLPGMEWRPSIHMPKSACRLWLKVTDVRVQRVQDISEEDALAEGSFLGRCPCPQMQRPPRDNIDALFRQAGCHIHGDEFRHLWNSIYARKGLGWDANPWVWAYTYEITDRPEGWPHKRR